MNQASVACAGNLPRTNHTLEMIHYWMPTTQDPTKSWQMIISHMH